MKVRKVTTLVLSSAFALTLLISGIILSSLHNGYSELIGDSIVIRELEVVEDTERMVVEDLASENQRIKELFGDTIEYKNINSWNLEDVNSELVSSLDSIDSTPILGWVHYYWLGGKNLREKNLPKALKVNASYNDEIANSVVRGFFESTCERVTGGVQANLDPIPYGYDATEIPVFYRISALEAISYCDQSKVVPNLRDAYVAQVEGLRDLYLTNPEEYSPQLMQIDKEQT